MTDRSAEAGSRSAARRPCLEEKVAELSEVANVVGVQLGALMPAGKRVVGTPLPDESELVVATAAA